MKVLLAGGTGVIGHRALPALVAAGHDVTVASRRTSPPGWLRALGTTSIPLDVFDADAVSAAAGDVDAIVNLATRIPSAPALLRRSAWAANDRLRREASAAMATAAIRVGARFVQESFAPTYPDRGADWITEDVALDPVDQVESVVDAEANAARVTAAGGIGVVLRFAMFYDATSRDTRALLAGARKGRFGLPGPSSRHLSMVHVADAGTAIVAALDVPAGTYNVVEDDPTTVAGHCDALASLLGIDRVRPLPALLGRLPQLRVMSRSQRVSNERLRSVAAWRPAVPSGHEGWARVIEEIALGRPR